MAMVEALKQWARARMEPQTWERMSSALQRAGMAATRAGSEARRWASIGSEHVTSMRAARIEPWRLLFAASIVVVLGVLLAWLPVTIATTVPAIAFLLAVALATYVADWVGGLTATCTALLVLDLLFLGAQGRFDFWLFPYNTWTLLAFAICAGLLVALFEHLKYDRAAARLEAAAMRAANTAFNAVEIAAASRPAGDSEAFVNVLQSILTAMVRVNRASAGALYLVDSATGELVQAAAYGAADEAGDDTFAHAPRSIPIDAGLVGRVARERRPITIHDAALDVDLDDVLSVNPHVRGAVGVPLVGPTDALLGVAWVGLYVPHTFTQTSIARLQALAHRTVAFMESARLADAQEEMLDRVQNNHRRLQAVIQTMPEAVMVARPPRGVIVTCNAAAQRMFGLPADGAQVIPRRADQLPITSDPPDAVPVMPIMQAMEQGITVTGVELLVRTPSGETIPVVASAAPLRTEDGEIDAVVGVFQDVGPLKEAERLRDEFISVVSHELRSPLTPIRGFAQVMARDLEREGNHDQHVAWLKTLQRHTDRLTRLVDDLLDVSRLRAGRLTVHRAPGDLVELCRAIVEAKQATHDTHEVVLETSLPSVVAMIDADRIQQVIDNLVSNAIKYTEGGRITVRIVDAPERGAITIEVMDEGQGIPPAEREALFTPFHRLRAAAESAVPGLGLGLYITRELVQAHGGTIAVGDAPGGGARFTITLPRAAEPARLTA